GAGRNRIARLARARRRDSSSFCSPQSEPRWRGGPARHGSVRRSAGGGMLALLCGRQGTLSPTAFELLASQPAAEPVFCAATAYVGYDPRELIRTRDPDERSSNHISQILTVTATLANYACIADVLPKPTAVAGYSVGEMAAWSIAGIWTADEALRLTDVRARLMESVAGPKRRLGDLRGLGRQPPQGLAEKDRCRVAGYQSRPPFLGCGGEPRRPPLLPS